MIFPDLNYLYTCGDSVNEALRAAESDKANNMSRMTGGLNLGGLF